jgi:hypothetical protein
MGGRALGQLDVAPAEEGCLAAAHFVLGDCYCCWLLIAYVVLLCESDFGLLAGSTPHPVNCPVFSVES